MGEWDSVGQTSDSVSRSSDSVGRSSDSVGRSSDSVGRSSDSVGRSSDSVGHSLWPTGATTRVAPTGEVSGGWVDAVERALRWPMREGVASAHWKIAPPEGELPQAGADAVRRPRLAGLGTSPSVAARQLPLGGSDWIGLLGGRFQGGIFARGSGGRGDQGGRSPDSVGHSLRPTGERVTSSFPGGWRGLGILLRGRWDCHQGV